MTNRFMRRDSCSGLVVVGAESRNFVRGNLHIIPGLSGIENWEKFVWAKRCASLLSGLTVHEMPRNALALFLTCTD